MTETPSEAEPSKEHLIFVFVFVLEAFSGVGLSVMLIRYKCASYGHSLHSLNNIRRCL